jgi:hypothetical protein
MTIDRAKTIEMAREAGIEMEHIVFRSSHASLERFAALVRAQVLEEAARVCDDDYYEHDAKECATIIRGMKSDSVHPATADAGASTAPLPEGDQP